MMDSKREKFLELQRIVNQNKGSGAHMVWQHLRDESGTKMENKLSKKTKLHHELYVQRALKKAAQNENSYQRESSQLISTNTRDQVLLMFRAAQKNKTKASNMLGGKLKNDSVNYFPGMLAEAEPEDRYGIKAHDTECFVEDAEGKDTAQGSESSTLAYQKIKVQPLAPSSRNVSRNSLSWQPLSMTALQEYSPQITAAAKTQQSKEKLWNVV